MKNRITNVDTKAVKPAYISNLEARFLSSVRARSLTTCDGASITRAAFCSPRSAKLAQNLFFDWIKPSDDKNSGMKSNKYHRAFALMVFKNTNNATDINRLIIADSRRNCASYLLMFVSPGW